MNDYYRPEGTSKGNKNQNLPEPNGKKANVGSYVELCWKNEQSERDCNDLKPHGKSTKPGFMKT